MDPLNTDGETVKEIDGSEPLSNRSQTSFLAGETMVPEKPKPIKKRHVPDLILIACFLLYVGILLSHKSLPV